MLACRSTIVAIFVSLALAGCDRNQSQTPQQSTINQTPSAHSQTKALRAASAVGYDGKQLQKQVDRVLKQKQKRDGDLEKALDDTDPMTGRFSLSESAKANKGATKNLINGLLMD